jgi:hypothetical protein
LPDGLARRVQELLGERLDWEMLTTAAWRHGVLPLLFSNIRRAASETTIPAEVMHRLRQGYVRAAVRNQAHLQAIALLRERFDKSGVDMVLLKGAALAQTTYRDPALRPFADIDLLVHARDIDSARIILFDSGYALAPELLSESFNRKYHANLPFVRQGERPVHIELHWKLTDSFSGIAFDHEALIRRAQRQPGGKVLSTEDTLVYLAAHLDNHGYLNRAMLEQAARAAFPLDELSANRLIWFTDLHELIAAREVDWPLVKQHADESGAAGALGVTLRWLQKLLGTAIDTNVLHDLPPAAPRWPERKMGQYVSALVTQADRRSSRRAAFQRKLLTTRKGFELRPIRLIDLWEYMFPVRSSGSHVAHVVRAVAHCAAMFAELQFHRLLRRVKQRTA